MNIELTACNNKLTIVHNNGLNFIFSYKSLIGLYYNNFLFLDNYYKNYSVTTNKHISYVKQYYYLNDESRIINTESALFDNITESNFNKDLLKDIINLSYTKDNVIEYLKEYQNNYNDPDVKKDLLKNKKHIESFLNLKALISGGVPDAIKLIDNKSFSLKTVNKIIQTFSIYNVTFKYERTYKNNNGALINIKIKNIKESNINERNIKEYSGRL